MVDEWLADGKKSDDERLHIGVVIFSHHPRHRSLGRAAQSTPPTRVDIAIKTFVTSSRHGRRDRIVRCSHVLSSAKISHRATGVRTANNIRLWTQILGDFKNTRTIQNTLIQRQISQGIRVAQSQTTHVSPQQNLQYMYENLVPDRYLDAPAKIPVLRIMRSWYQLLMRKTCVIHHASMSAVRVHCMQCGRCRFSIYTRLKC